MQVVNTAIPIRDRAIVQQNIDGINAMFGTGNDPINQMDVVPDQGRSGYKLTATAEQVVVARIAELESHRVGSDPLPNVTWSAIYYFKVDLTSLPVQEGVPDVEDAELPAPKAAVSVESRLFSIGGKTKKGKKG